VPHVSAAGAAVATDRHDQRGRSATLRFMGEPPGDGVTRYALTAATATPGVVVDDTPGQDGSVMFDALAGDHEAELVEADELGQVRAREGSVRQVRVFWMGWCRNLHFQEALTPARPSPRRGRYTLNWEEPVMRLFGFKRGWVLVGHLWVAAHALAAGCRTSTRSRPADGTARAEVPEACTSGTSAESCSNATP